MKRPKAPEAVKLAKRRMTTITPARRKEIATGAAKARWKKKA